MGHWQLAKVRRQGHVHRVTIRSIGEVLLVASNGSQHWHHRLIYQAALNGWSVMWGLISREQGRCPFRFGARGVHGERYFHTPASIVVGFHPPVGNHGGTLMH